MAQVSVKITKLDEMYCGKPTGNIVYHTEVKGGCHPMGAVLGRGATPQMSIYDFVFRAQCDGHKIVKQDINVVEQNYTNL